MSRTVEQEAAEGTILAPPLYPAVSVQVQADGSVVVVGPPARGEMYLMSCYTPAWWYAVCRACHYLYAANSTDHEDPALRAGALAHRCDDPHGLGRES